MFLHPWVFGEVKRVRIPKGMLPILKLTQEYQGKGPLLFITENNNNKTSDQVETKDCSVVLTTLNNLQNANIQNKKTKPQDANVTPPPHREQPVT